MKNYVKTVPLCRCFCGLWELPFLENALSRYLAELQKKYNYF